MAETLKITGASDDIIGYEFKGDGLEVNVGQAKFLVTLPDGTELPIKAEYDMDRCGGWGFAIELPKGSKVKPEFGGDDDD